jgi:hypothetical protein
MGQDFGGSVNPQFGVESHFNKNAAYDVAYRRGFRVLLPMQSLCYSAQCVRVRVRVRRHNTHLSMRWTLVKK